MLAYTAPKVGKTIPKTQHSVLRKLIEDLFDEVGILRSKIEKIKFHFEMTIEKVAVISEKVKGMFIEFDRLENSINR